MSDLKLPPDGPSSMSLLDVSRSPSPVFVTPPSSPALPPSPSLVPPLPSPVTSLPLTPPLPIILKSTIHPENSCSPAGTSDSDLFSLRARPNNRDSRFWRPCFRLSSSSVDSSFSLTQQTVNTRADDELLHVQTPGVSDESRPEAPSQPNDGNTNLVKCDMCDKLCKGQKGLKIHMSKSHSTRVMPKSNQNVLQTDTHSGQAQTSLPNPPMVKCDLCGKFFKSINQHMVSGHPEAYRQRIVNKNSANHTQPADTFTTNSTGCDQVELIRRELNVFLNRNWSEMDEELMENNLIEFQNFLKDVIHLMPGPKHPAVKYYQLRKKGIKSLSSQNSNFKTSSNPARRTKRDRLKRREAYIYQTIQFEYFTCRKKAVRKIIQDESRTCPITTQQFEDYFKNSIGVENCNVDHLIDNSRENDESVEISVDDVKDAMNRMNIDSAAGVDGVMVKAVKMEGMAEILVKIFNQILVIGVLPKCWKLGRTVLLDKGTDIGSMKNWRPITILPVLRRLFEKIIEKRIREDVAININQRGFMPMPGCAINLTIVETALEEARRTKKDLVCVFIDIKQAYNNIGHQQIKKSLERTNIPSCLKNMINDCQIGNQIKLEVGLNKSKNILIQRGLMQGAPLSPILYNMATNHIVEEITEEGIVNNNGANITDSIKMSAVAFADDICLLCRNMNSAETLYEMVDNRLSELGLGLNQSKTQALVIKQGVLSIDEITLGGHTIKPASQENVINYLGTTLKDKIVLDKNKTIDELNKKINKVVTSPYLKADQKITVLNNYIWPIFTYKLQNTPVDRWSIPFIEDLDKMIRSATKQILEIPRDVPDSMIYSRRNVRGLQMFRFSWEIIIQRINLFLSLKKQPDDVIHRLRDLDDEIQKCLDKLSITPVDANINTKSIREELRLREYNNWKSMSVRGLGVCLFEEGKSYNKWLSTREGLSNSEMTEVIKMSSNTSAVRGLHGRSQDGVQCRRCQHTENKPIETLAHVLGACHYGHLLRVNRHNTVRALIANELRKSYEVYEEVGGLANDGSVRRIDIIAIDRKKKSGIIIDPTIRFEVQQVQPLEVDKEKKDIYLPTVTHYKEKYSLEEIEVVGLMIGARGTITSFFINFCKRFNINQETMKRIVHATIRSSIHILRNHIYTSI